MRILHVLDHSLPTQSGYSFRSQAILREQRALGWETVQVTSPKHGAAAQPVETVDGIDFHRILATKGWMGSLPVLDQIDTVRQLRRGLRQIVAARNPDLIQAHSPCLNALAALGLGKPLIYEMRSSWEDAAVSSGTTVEGSVRYRLSRALETYVLKRAQAVTTICEGLREEVCRRGVSAERITVVPNAVDADSLALPTGSVGDLRSQWGLTGQVVVGFIGSFFAWEGLPFLVAALAPVLRARSDIRVLLVGGGIDEPNVRAVVAREGLEKHVVFAGHVRHDQIRAAYDAVDILVYPRVPIRLTEMVTPLKPLEAMALGKVLVASDVGGHRELVRDGVTGLLFRAGDATALADAVVRVASDRDLRAAFALAGPRFVREERTWAKVVPRYEAVYRSLLTAPRAAPAAERA